MAESSRSKESIAWQYFDKVKNEEASRCKKCNAVIQCKGWSTSGMIRHLKSRHCIGKTEEPRQSADLGDTEASFTKRTPVEHNLTCDVKEEIAESLPVETVFEEVTSSDPNKHQLSILKTLYEDSTFTDVTLTAHGQSLKAHKAVLSAMSPYFKEVLEDNPCQHPIIIMPLDVSYQDLHGIVCYIYKGEITVPSEKLASLLKSAEALQISGLISSDNFDVGGSEDEEKLSFGTPKAKRKRQKQGRPKTEGQSSTTFKRKKQNVPCMSLRHERELSDTEERSPHDENYGIKKRVRNQAEDKYSAECRDTFVFSVHSNKSSDSEYVQQEETGRNEEDLQDEVLDFNLSEESKIQQQESIKQKKHKLEKGTKLAEDSITEVTKTTDIVCTDTGKAIEEVFIIEDPL